jgi:potassium efflux system protein
MTADRAESAILIDNLSQQTRALDRLLRGKVAELVDTESLNIDTNNPIYAVATGLVAMEAAVREEQIRLNEELDTVHSLTDEVGRISYDVTDRFNTARRLVDFGGGSDGLGAVLTLYWDEIENFTLPYSKASFNREAGRTVVQRIQHEETLEKLASATAYINQELENAGIDADTLLAADQEILLGLASSYRERLRATINTQSDYIEALRVLGDGYLELTGQTSEYKKYLQSLILWIPDRPPLWNVSADSIPKEVAALKSAFESTKLSVKPGLLFGLVGFALLWSFRARLHTFQLHLNTLIRRPRDDSTRNTVLALACIALRALPSPLLLVSIASLFTDGTVSTVLINAGIALFVCNYVRLVCAPDGAGPVHFDWPDAIAERLHREFGWLGRIVLPLAIIAFLILGITVNTGGTVLGRIAVISVLALPLISIISYLAGHARKYGSSWMRVRTLQLRIALGLLLAMLIAAVVLGHSYSTRVILASLAETVLIGFCLILIHGILSRWIIVTRRKIRLLELMTAKTEQGKAEDGTLEDPEANLGDVSAETRELINVGTVITAFVTLLYIWAPLLPALDAMTQVILWTSSTTVDGQTVESHFTLAALFKVVALVALTVYAAHKLPALIELILRSRTSVSPSSRYTTIALLNYVIVGGGITMALSALGLQWSELQWLVAALGVGIGFGLQEIIANFISGLIILFERPIRVGDVISTGGNDGTVTRIRIRATAIRDWDGKELLVPNKEFITGRLLNWTLSDAKVRTVIPVGIAYGSDVELAITTLHSAVSSHSRVIDDPPLQIIFEGFGDDALLLSARFYLDSLEDRLLAVTEINREFIGHSMRRAL